MQARPDSRLIKATEKIGVKLYGVFVESALSASNDLTESWTRRRFVPSGGKTETGGPAGAYQSETVLLKFTRENGDDYDDFAPVRGEVVGLTGTLQNGDLLISALHGTFQVRGVFIDGDYEKARLER